MQTVLMIVAGLLALAVLAVAWSAWRTIRLARTARAQVPRAGALTPVPGGAIHHVEIGNRDGPAVVFIPGLGAHLQQFTYAMTDLLKADFRLIVLDRPGVGYSRRDSDRLAGIEAQAGMIGDFLDRLGVVRPVVVGHSLGGAVALALALNRPGDVAALALINPLVRGDDGAPPRVLRPLLIRSGLLRRLLAWTIAIPAAARVAEPTLDAIFAPEAWPRDFMTRAGGALGLRPGAFIAAAGDAVAAADGIAALAERYRDLSVHGAVLCGAADPILPPHEQGLAMRHFGLDCRTLPDAGHMIPITAPAVCADFVRVTAGIARSSDGDRVNGG